MRPQDKTVRFYCVYSQGLVIWPQSPFESSLEIVHAIPYVACTNLSVCSCCNEDLRTVSNCKGKLFCLFRMW